MRIALAGGAAILVSRAAMRGIVLTSVSHIWRCARPCGPPTPV